MKHNVEEIVSFFDLDSYKLGQWKMYPENSTDGMLYAEARKKGIETKFFGLQYALDQITCPTVEMVEAANEWVKVHIGRDDIFNYEGWMQIATMGYLPIEVRAVKEGTVVPSSNALFTIRPTHPDFVWLLSWYETQLVRTWYPISVVTLDWKIKQLISEYLELTGTPEAINFKLHDFGSRACTSREQAGIGGMAHMVNFSGSDTLAGWMFAQKYYDAVPETLAFNIPASEHSTITAWGREGEFDAYENMVQKLMGPNALVSCVSDSYNIWEALKMWKELEPQILEKGGTLVVRPDSGDPVETPVKVVEELINLFGSTYNEKGFRVLPDHIRVIQGDGVNYDSIEKILEELYDRAISADNITFGMGSALLQNHNRDDLSFTMKMSAITVDGVERDVFKSPIGASSKNSKAGYLTLTEDFETVRIKDLNGRNEALQAVWKDGYFLRRWTFDEVRGESF